MFKTMRIIVGILVSLGLALGGCAPAPQAPSTPDAIAQPAAASAPTKSPTIQPTAATSVEITHAQGRTTVPLNPTKVVVFDYSALDTLDQLGVPVAGVPQELLPPFLAKYKGSQYTNIGSLFEPDYEKLNTLKPDLIIVGGRSAAVYGELAKLAPTIDVTVDAKNLLPSFKARTMSLATIFGKQQEASAKLTAIDDAITRVKSKAAAQQGKGLIVLVTGGKVTAYGPGSRFGLIHDLLGVPPVSSTIEVSTHGNAISFEYIQEMNPDLLYVIDRDAATGAQGQAAKQVLDNALVRTTTAWTNGDVTYLDPTTWYLAGNGLGTLMSMVSEIEGSLE